MNRSKYLSLCRLLTGPVLLAVSLGAMSQTAPLSRADVKAATKDAAAKHQLQPAGEGVAPDPLPATRSNRTRAQRKAETVQSVRAGELFPAGEGTNLKAERAALLVKSTKTRSERKAETLAAAKAKTLIPAGENLGSSSRP